MSSSGSSASVIIASTWIVVSPEEKNAWRKKSLLFDQLFYLTFICLTSSFKLAILSFFLEAYDILGEIEGFPWDLFQKCRISRMIRYFEKFTTNPFNTTGSKRTPFRRSTRPRGGKQNKTIQNEKRGLPHSIGDKNTSIRLENINS